MGQTIIFPCVHCGKVGLTVGTGWLLGRSWQISLFQHQRSEVQIPRSAKLFLNLLTALNRKGCLKTLIK